MILGLECTVLLVCGIMHLIGGVYLGICPAYEKHELLRNFRLDQKSVCRAAQFKFTDKICLNGLQPTAGIYCVAGPCTDKFGHSCGDPCYAGLYDSKDDLECNAKADKERVNLCQYYQEQLNQTLENQKSSFFSQLFSPLGSVTGLISWISYGDLRETVLEICKGIIPPQSYV